MDRVRTLEVQKKAQMASSSPFRVAKDQGFLQENCSSLLASSCSFLF